MNKNFIATIDAQKEFENRIRDFGYFDYHIYNGYEDFDGNKEYQLFVYHPYYSYPRYTRFSNNGGYFYRGQLNISYFENEFENELEYDKFIEETLKYIENLFEKVIPEIKERYITLSEVIGEDAKELGGALSNYRWLTHDSQECGPNLYLKEESEKIKEIANIIKKNNEILSKYVDPDEVLNLGKDSRENDKQLTKRFELNEKKIIAGIFPSIIDKRYHNNDGYLWYYKSEHIPLIKKYLECEVITDEDFNGMKN